MVSMGGRGEVRVFVSYSHDSPALLSRVAQMAEGLRKAGFVVFLDQWQRRPLAGWPALILTEFRRADAVVCVCTPTYRDRVDGVSASGRGKGATFEGSMIRNETYVLRSTADRFFALHMDETSLAIPEILGGASAHVFQWPQDQRQLIESLEIPTKRRQLMRACTSVFSGTVEPLETWARGFMDFGVDAIVDFDGRSREIADAILRLPDPSIQKEVLASLASAAQTTERLAIETMLQELDLGSLPNPPQGPSAHPGPGVGTRQHRRPLDTAEEANYPADATLKGTQVIGTQVIIGGARDNAQMTVVFSDSTDRNTGFGGWLRSVFRRH